MESRDAAIRHAVQRPVSDLTSVNLASHTESLVDLYDFGVGGNEAHLWLTYFDEIDYESLHLSYRSVLSKEELDRQAAFHFLRDQRRFLVTRVLVRTVLSKYAALAPEDLTFNYNAYGRPELANPIARRLSFNISHTNSLVVLAVTEGRALGVDVENLRQPNVPLEVAERFFAKEEMKTLTSLPAEERQERFMEYWTLKESYIKARGMGLSIPLDTFHFRYPLHDVVEICFDSAWNDVPARWTFWQLRPRPEYLIAVCAEKRQSTPTLLTREIVPGGSAAVIVPRILRQSA